MCTCIHYLTATFTLNSTTTPRNRGCRCREIKYASALLLRFNIAIQHCDSTLRFNIAIQHSFHDQTGFNLHFGSATAKALQPAEGV